MHKNGGVTALLASTLAISNPASTFNLVIENTAFTGSGIANDQVGQSFINDPVSPNGSGMGINVLLNSFTFGFLESGSQSLAAQQTLTIFDGTGSGGFARASATSTSTSAVAGISRPVTWTFASSVALIETSTYTAVIRTQNPTINFLNNNSNPYRNGSTTVGSIPVSFQDLVFRANFTVQPVPFEFSPALGLSVLGGLWGLGLVAKRIKKAKSKQKPK